MYLRFPLIISPYGLFIFTIKSAWVILCSENKSIVYEEKSDVCKLNETQQFLFAQPGCIEPNSEGQCYVGMPGEKLGTPMEEARSQNQDNDNNDTDISEVEETEENWFN
ncbi:MAG: hypothetical protein WCC82_12190 [Nitrososphaeraceae archaeon]